MQSRTTTTVMLGIAQTLAWASSYYLPAVLAGVIAKDVGTSASVVFGAFSVALLLAAAVGPYAGRFIDRLGGRPVLCASNVVFAAGLAALSLGLVGTSAAAAFAVLHGLGNGILTIAIGTLPLLIFGAEGYGQRQGFLMVPARIVQAAAPFLFGMAVGRWGDGALWFSAGLGASAFLALVVMKAGMNTAARLSR